MSARRSLQRRPPGQQTAGLGSALGWAQRQRSLRRRVSARIAHAVLSSLRAFRSSHTSENIADTLAVDTDDSDGASCRA
jgi:hypothetical protein